MLEKLEVIDSINVLESGHIEVRQATKILEDGKELSKSYHRWVISPGDEITAQDKKVQDIAKAIHTKEIVDKYKEKLDKDKLAE